MRIETTRPLIESRPAFSRPAVETPTTSPAATSAGRVDTADFTSMTRGQLLDWMNGKIRAGELSLDDTSGLLGMTMSMPVGGGLAAPDDTQKLDFISLASDGLAAAEARGDRDGTRSLRDALAVMRHYQGSVTGLDITA